MKVLRHSARQRQHALHRSAEDEPLAKAAQIMAEKDIGSLVVMEHGDLVGMLTFREVIVCIVNNGGEIGTTTGTHRPWTTTR